MHPRREKFTTLKNELFLFAAGASGIVLYFLCENAALVYAQASSVGPLVATTPVMTLLLSAWFNRDGTITRATIVGCLAGLAGVVLVFCNGGAAPGINAFGDILAPLAALSWAVYCILLKRITGITNVITLTRRIFGYALIAMIPLLCVTGLHARIETPGEPSLPSFIEEL